MHVRARHYRLALTASHGRKSLTWTGTNLTQRRRGRGRRLWNRLHKRFCLKDQSSFGQQISTWHAKSCTEPVLLCKEVDITENKVVFFPLVVVQCESLSNQVKIKLCCSFIPQLNHRKSHVWRSPHSQWLSRFGSWSLYKTLENSLSHLFKLLRCLIVT